MSLTTSLVLRPDVQIAADVASLDAPTRLWRLPVAPDDPTRMHRWGAAFGFQPDEINRATDTVLTAADANQGHLELDPSRAWWTYTFGAPGWYIRFDTPGPGVFPLADDACTRAVSSTNATVDESAPCDLPAPATAEQKARTLWRAMGLDTTGRTVAVAKRLGGIVVTADTTLDGVTWAQLRVFIGDHRRLIRAEGSFGAPTPTTTTPRLGLAAALDRYAREPVDAIGHSGPPRLEPPDGTYHIIGVTPGLARSSDGVLGPTYIVTATDVPAFMIPASFPSYLSASIVD